MYIPVWLFVLMLVFSLFCVGAMLIIFGTQIIGVFLNHKAKKRQKERQNTCPDFIEGKNE